jgi:radical SAM-linked protein
MKVRVRFTKVGKVRFTSHRDIARVWERVLRRADVPVAYSEGFSPRPKLSFGLALPTGGESLAEYLDVDVDEGRPAPDLDALPELLSELLPEGMDATALSVLEPGADSLQHAVVACTWNIRVPGVTAADLTTAAERALAADTLVITRERKGKPVTDDVRPAITSLAVLTTPSDGAEHGTERTAACELEAELATQTRSLRPSELVTLLDPEGEAGDVRVCRLHQWIEAGGVRVEPVALPDAPAPHAQRRAS